MLVHLKSDANALFVCAADMSWTMAEYCDVEKTVVHLLRDVQEDICPFEPSFLKHARKPYNVDDVRGRQCG